MILPNRAPATDRPRSVTDQVYQEVQSRILTLELPPGTRLSESDTAAQFGCSRQPVRDAFFRLSQQGLLLIRPQRATEVTAISAEAIRAARFLRTATEVEMVRQACQALGSSDLEALEHLLDAQEDVVLRNDPETFRTLDDDFHARICAGCGLAPVWPQIGESKAHTDRLRTLSLHQASQQALEDHRAILAGLCSRDPVAAMTAMREHLGRIIDVMDELRQRNHHWFVDETEATRPRARPKTD